MGKRDKNKKKKRGEIRIILNEEMESTLQNLSINIQLSFSVQPEVKSTIDTTQNPTEEEPTEELSATMSDNPQYEDENF